MSFVAPARRPRPAVRRVGYLAAVAVNAALLIIINSTPGWHSFAFLTSATPQVLGVLNAAVAVNLAVNLVYLAYDEPWLKALGELAVAGIGLAASARVLQVFPFSFHGTAAWCGTALRVLLIVAIAGFSISILVQVVSLARLTAGATRHGHPDAGA